MTTAYFQARESVRSLTDNMGADRLKAECVKAISDVYERYLHRIRMHIEDGDTDEALRDLIEALG